MKNGIKFLVTIILFFVSFIVADAATFTTANCSEPNYIRNAVGSNTKLTDVDGQTILLPTGHRVEVLEEVNGWYKIFTNYYSNNYTGYINASYFTNKQVYTIDANYVNSLKTQGFPSSYVTPLAKLHAIHPNWVFVPTKVIDWNASIAGEMENYKTNLIQASSDRRLWSTENGAYSNGTYIPQDNGSWYAASKQTVMFYMDPRNWFHEKTMFMFESLNFNSAYQTAANTRNTILKGTFIDSNSFAKMLYNAGSANDVSTFHLASRLIGEQGTSGSATAEMTDSDGQKYYNYFNIGATGSGSAAIIANALKTAKANGWNTPQKAITGGAAFIKNDYINYGQNTIYFQKFNTINTSAYWHQYQQNVRVCPGESYSTFGAYNNIGVIDTAIKFIIPIYSNIPAATSLAMNADTNNSLKSLSITNCSLNPKFNSGTVTYQCKVANSVDTVKVSATAASATATIKGTGNKTLKEGDNVIKVKVTAASGDVKTYKVTITKASASTASPDDVVSKAGLNNNSSYLTGIKYQRSSTNFVNDLKATYDLVDVVYTKNANNKGDVVATGDTVKVTLNNITKTYTIVIKGDVSGDGGINSIDYTRIRAYFFGRYQLTGAAAKAGDVSGDGIINSIDYTRIRAFFFGRYTIVQ